MREFGRVTCVLAFCGFAIAAAIPWSDDHPSQATWWCRIGFPAAAVVSIVGFLLFHVRRDLAPDYLSQCCGRFFDRNGFCFSFLVESEDGVCMLHLLFQNRYERRSVAFLAIRPAVGLFRKKETAIVLRIECGPAAFGRCRVPLGVRLEHQGKRRKFHVGAQVQYPEGKGRMLRFRDGMAIRHDTTFHSALETIHTVTALTAGHFFVRTSPPYINVTIPTGVAETPPVGLLPRTETLWSLGDDPTKDVAAILAAAENAPPDDPPSRMT